MGFGCGGVGFGCTWGRHASQPGVYRVRGCRLGLTAPLRVSMIGAVVLFLILALVAVASIWATWFALRQAKRRGASDKYRQAMRNRSRVARPPTGG